MLELIHNQLRFQFPDVHEDASCQVEFIRTLRIPDDNRDYPLPPGFDNFPLDHIDDYEANIPDSWRMHGGIFFPMYQAEAMWINFDGDYPMAIKVATGKMNAVTGEVWKNELTRNPQDYLVVPDQPWLDGFCVEKGLIRQFVCMPLGEGFTAEEQLTGEPKHGGIQIVVYPMKASAYEELSTPASTGLREPNYCKAAPDMGLAPGGIMRQEIYEDDYGFEVWEQSAKSRCFVHIVNSLQYLELTGKEPPTKAPSSKQYTDARLPWFEYYDADKKALEGSKNLAHLDSVAVNHLKEGKGILQGNDPVSPGNIKIIQSGKHLVREGEF
ncbi:MAG: hypothetical protein FVQ80_19045 [Planctomycetes bacterium]|nr:hypothetical protein [Planctomycetota bacterium]